MKVICFAYFCYWISSLVNRNFNEKNTESVAAIRIFITFLQILAIINKMEATVTKNGGDLELQEFMDKILYYLSPE